MARIFNFYINENKSISNDINAPIMLTDLNVQNFRLHIPAELDGFDMGDWAWWFVYVNAKRVQYSVPLTLEEVELEDGETEYVATFAVDHSVTGSPGEITYAVEAVNADQSGTVLNEWHTRMYKQSVIRTIRGNHTVYAETENDIISALLSRVGALVEAGESLNELAETVMSAANAAQGIIDGIPQDYSELSSNVGDLTALETSNKASLVAAINEISQKRYTYICQISGNTDDGFAYVTGSSYSDLRAAVTGGISVYVTHDDKAYHLASAMSGTYAFISLDGTALEIFVISQSGIYFSSTALATSAALTAAISRWMATYDTLGLGRDIFQYAKGRADTVQENLDTLVLEVQAAYTINDGNDSYTYNNLHNAMQGLLSLIKAYVQARLVEYKAFTITIVNELPVAGQPMTFYLVPKDGGGYDKWWWITDAQNNGMWDVFGSATTLVVDALPQVGDEDADYILKTSAGCLYYKYFENAWHMVAGSLAEVVAELPQAGNVYTDYYCRNAAGTYVHYRWISGAWEVIGSDSYTKSKVDALISGVTASVSALSSSLDTTNSNVTSLSRTVERVCVYAVRGRWRGRERKEPVHAPFRRGRRIILHDTA